MILRTADGAGHSVDLERLLLPFGDDGQVNQIVASLQLISLEGAAERRKIVNNFGAQLDCPLSVKIPATSFTLPREKPRLMGSSGEASLDSPPLRTARAD